jgi:hypothetical protein
MQQPPAGQPVYYAPGYPYSQPIYPQPPAQRKRRTGLIVGLSIGGLVVLLVIAAAFGWGVFEVTHRTSAPPNLVDNLVPAPSGTHTPAGQPATRALDLKGIATAALDASASPGQFEEFGFVEGAERQWVASNGEQFFVVLLMFGGPADAQHFLELDTGQDVAGSWGPLRNADTVPTGIAFQKLATDSDGYWRALAMTDKGDVVIQVYVMATSPVQLTDAAAVLGQQYKRL